jgi:endoglucanase Acf2
MSNKAELFVWIGLVLAACGPSMLSPRAKPPPPPAEFAKKAGAGYYLIKSKEKVEVPANQRGKPVRPKVTADFTGVPTSNDWWSSLIWQFDAREVNPYSDPLYAHPFTFKATATGLEMGYPTDPQVDHRQYMFWHAADLALGIAGRKFPDTRVAGYSDWAVTAAWQDGEATFRATIGHGLPFVYVTKLRGGAAKLEPKKPADVWRSEGELLALSINGHHYAAFGPTGSVWNKENNAFSSDLNGKDYFSLAVLPDRSDKTLELFRKHAYAFVTDTRVSWRYDEKNASLENTFEVTTELLEPDEDRVNQPLLALYRHQWKNTKQPLLGLSYVSPRGEMKLLAGSRFTTRLPFNGVLPILPNVADNDTGDLEFYVKEIYWADDLFPPGLGENPQRDPYWIGKSLLKSALAAEIADQVGYANARDHLLQAVKNELQDWFDGQPPSYFYYDKTWRTLIGVPTAFFSGSQLNDHHFHWGYFIYAAAIVARHDPAWAKHWAPFIEILIRDAANHRRDDAEFPFLRWMDVYAGHSWANGPALFDEGNNEESSSEDINFSAATILWGAALGNREIRDLGIFLYANQVQAVEQYWFDVDDAVFPKKFDHTTVAMVWGAGGRYDTWWDPHPAFVHGINLLPMTGSMHYLGRHPQYVSKNYAEIVERNRGEPLTWRDILWMFLAFSEPERALKLFEDDPYFTPEFGNSRAMTYHLITNLAALGHVDTGVSADTPTYAVFKNKNRRTHIAYNAGSKPREVTFSDGTKLRVSPHTTAVSK